MSVRELDCQLSGPQLSEISNAIVGIHRRYSGRGATKARSFQVTDDLVLVELRDAYLAMERTLIQRGHGPTVRQTRLVFQEAMQRELVDVLERITGRGVLSYTSESLAVPEAILEIFYLEPTSQGVAALAQLPTSARRAAES